MGYKEDIKIDIDQLDQEWIKQAGLYQHYAKQEATALYERDQLIDSLALLQAQLDGDIRTNPEKFGITGKPTEAAILNKIKQQEAYTEANSCVMKSTCKAKIIGSAVRAFDHKKKALEKLTDLYLSGYWAAPKIKSEAQEVFGKQTRLSLEGSLKREERLVAASLEKEAEKEAERKTEKKKTETKGLDPAKPKLKSATQRAQNELKARKKIKAKSVALAQTKREGESKTKLRATRKKK